MAFKKDNKVKSNFTKITISLASPEEIQANTVFHELEEWSSLTGMAVIAFVKTAMGKKIEGKELKACVTVEDVYNLVCSK